MAQPQPSLAGAERIRALKDDGSVFQAFDAYPWNKDKTFMVLPLSLGQLFTERSQLTNCNSLVSTPSSANQTNKTPMHLSATWPSMPVSSTTPKE